MKRGTVTLRGDLVSFRARTEDGWGVGVIDIGDGTLLDFTGKTFGAPIGSTVELMGEWSDHPKFGRQFKVVSCVVDLPSTDAGVIAWLAATLPDVGETRARAMLSHFGTPANLWHVLEHEIDRLCEVPGITLDRAAAIAGVYLTHREDRDAMVVLRGWGLTDKQIRRCLKEWSTLDEVCLRIRANPYSLATYVHGFGFLKADQVAQTMGIKPNAQRVEAGIVYTLRVASYDGHCWLWGGQLQRMAADLLQVGMDDVARAIRIASAHRLIVRRGKRIYSAALESLEWKCSRALGRTLENLAPVSTTLH